MNSEDLSKLLIIGALLDRLGLSEIVVTKPEIQRLAGRKLKAAYGPDGIRVSIEPRKVPVQ